MANFPIFITPSPTKGLSPYGIQKPLDFSPLMKSFQMQQALRNKKAKDDDTTTSETPEGRTGSINQWQAVNDLALGKISEISKRLGDEAIYDPDYIKYSNILEQNNSAANLNTIKREEEAFTAAEKRMEKHDAQHLYNLPLFLNSKGQNVETNWETLERHEFGYSPSMYGFDIAGGNPNYFYDPTEMAVSSVVGPEYITEALTDIFAASDNQYTMTDLKNDITTGIVEGTQGIDDVEVLKKEKYKRMSDDRALRFSQNAAYATAMSGQSQPLAQAFMQDYLSKTNAAYGKYPINKVDANGNLILEDNTNDGIDNPTTVSETVSLRDDLVKDSGDGLGAINDNFWDGYKKIYDEELKNNGYFKIIKRSPLYICKK